MWLKYDWIKKNWKHEGPTDNWPKVFWTMSKIGCCCCWHMLQFILLNSRSHNERYNLFLFCLLFIKINCITTCIILSKKCGGYRKRMLFFQCLYFRSLIHFQMLSSVCLPVSLHGMVPPWVIINWFLEEQKHKHNNKISLNKGCGDRGTWG